jgi:Flp pilus assembly pilin Flp
MIQWILRLHREQEGQDVIEYGVLGAFISIVAIATIKLIGPQITPLFEAIKTALT